MDTSEDQEGQKNHCPLSQTYKGSGIYTLSRVHAQGWHVGEGRTKGTLLNWQGTAYSESSFSRKPEEMFFDSHIKTQCYFQILK